MNSAEKRFELLMPKAFISRAPRIHKTIAIQHQPVAWLQVKSSDGVIGTTEKTNGRTTHLV